jgi:hypothetical protein
VRILGIFLAIAPLAAASCAHETPLSASERALVLEAAILSSLGDPPYGHPDGPVDALCLATYSPGDPPEDSGADPLNPVPADVLRSLASHLVEATGLDVMEDVACKRLPGRRHIVTRSDGRPALIITVFEPIWKHDQVYKVHVAVVAAGLWGHSTECLVDGSGGKWMAECRTVLISSVKPSNTRLEQAA